MVLKDELKPFGINLEDIKSESDTFSMINEAIEKMSLMGYLVDNLEVVLNSNLLEVRNKHTRESAIFGVKCSFQPLEKDMSFIVRKRVFEEPDYKKMYFDLKERIKSVIDE